MHFIYYRRARQAVVPWSAVGVLASAATAGVTSFVPHPRALFEHRPERPRDMSRYVNLGVELGLAFGTMFALQEGFGHVDDSRTEGTQLLLIGSGLIVGFVTGLVTYFIQH